MDELISILIVEDRSFWIDNVKEMISEVGTFHILTANDKQSALKKFKAGKIKAAIIDLNLSDSIQQEKYEGIDLIHAIREQEYNFPVIVLTGCIHFDETEFEKNYRVEKLFVKSSLKPAAFKKVFEETIKKTKREKQ